MSKETKTTAPAPEAMTAEEIVAKAQAEAEAIRAAALTEANDIRQQAEEEAAAEQQQEEHAVPAVELACGVGKARIDGSRRKERRHREEQRLFVHGAGPDRHGERGNKACVADHRADGVAIGNTGVALHGSLGGHHDLRQRRADGHHRCADEQLRQMKAVGDADRPVYKPVAALDEHHKAQKEQQNRNQHIHSPLRFYTAPFARRRFRPKGCASSLPTGAPSASCLYRTTQTAKKQEREELRRCQDAIGKKGLRSGGFCGRLLLRTEG